jgi:predicted  nucleic acid-binding Zn-ribbon protein
MENAAFEALAEKVELAVSRIESLKQELSGKDAEIEKLRGELDARSENLSQAGDRVRALVTRLEAALV